MSDRSDFDELVEEYPLDRDGDKEFTGHAFGTVLQ